MANGWGRCTRREMTAYATNRTPTASSTVVPTHVALSTANPADDGQSIAEPTSTGGYARQTVTWADPVAYTSVTNDTAVLTKHSSISFGASSAAWSTGATVLTHVVLYASSSSTAETNYRGRAAITTPPAVASAGITLTIAADAIQMGLISS